MDTTLRRERDSSSAPVNNTIDACDARDVATSLLRACVCTAVTQRSAGANGDLLRLLTVQLRVALRGRGRFARVCRPRYTNLGWWTPERR